MVSKKFIQYNWFVLVVTLLVVIAGSVVRTTQSGMGCPDWPTCFGKIVPPTQMKEVLFQPNHTYKRKQFIIYNDSLWYAKQKFISSNTFNYSNWNAYEKHNYAHFNALQTWIEYINRLLGALLGIFVLIQAIWSLRYYKTNKAIVTLSIGLVLLTGFQAWLGKTVVDSNLALLKISLHMFGAIAMLFVSVAIAVFAKQQATIFISKNTYRLLLLLFIMVLLQVVLGTEVRAQIDTIAAQYNYENRPLWIAGLNGWFQLHRLAAMLIVGLAIYLWLQVAANAKAKKLMGWVVFCCLAEIVVGIVLNYINFNPFAQPIHLLISSIILSLLFYGLLAMQRHKIY
jgi:heme a synthase